MSMQSTGRARYAWKIRMPRQNTHLYLIQVYFKKKIAFDSSLYLYDSLKPVIYNPSV